MKPYRIRIATTTGVRTLFGLFASSFDAVASALDIAGPGARISARPL